MRCYQGSTKSSLVKIIPKYNDDIYASAVFQLLMDVLANFRSSSAVYIGVIVFLNSREENLDTCGNRIEGDRSDCQTFQVLVK